jgi:hypothetical protein
MEAANSPLSMKRENAGASFHAKRDSSSHADKNEKRRRARSE